MLLAVGAAIALWLAPLFAVGVHVFWPSAASVPQPVHMVAADLLTAILIATCAATLVREWRAARLVPKAGLMSAVS